MGKATAYRGELKELNEPLRSARIPTLHTHDLIVYHVHTSFRNLQLLIQSLISDLCALKKEEPNTGPSQLRQ